VCLCGFLVLTLPAAAQPLPRFEVASIHRNTNGSLNTNINVSDGGRLSIVNGSLKTLIRNAYGILSFQLANEPNWIDTEMYDIEAKTATSGKISPDEFKSLLQSLLADRFHLKVHWETRESTVYALLLDKSGPKFTASLVDEKSGMNTRKGPDKATMTGTAEPMKDLASNLGNQLGRFAVDKTGLTGTYDFTFSWDPQSTADSTGPSLFTALRDQLGLRLESQKGPVELLVIDNADRPSEN
jgi:uncharacterized protein (TIGR03435 family)